jgi:hypothetical protein
LRGEGYRSPEDSLLALPGFAFDPSGVARSRSSSAGGSTMGCLQPPGAPDTQKLRPGKVSSVDDLCKQDGLRLARLKVSGLRQDPHVDAVPRRASAVALSRLNLRLSSAAAGASSSRQQVGEGEALV